MLGHIFVWGTVLFTVYGQLIIKWRVSQMPPMPEEFGNKILAMLGLIFSPWVLSSLFAAFLAFLCWVGAVMKLELSFAYPYQTSLTFALVITLSILLFGESFSTGKAGGVLLIGAGIFLASKY